MQNNRLLDMQPHRRIEAIPEYSTTVAPDYTLPLRMQAAGRRRRVDRARLRLRRKLWSCTLRRRIVWRAGGFGIAAGILPVILGVSHPMLRSILACSLTSLVTAFVVARPLVEAELRQMILQMN